MTSDPVVPATTIRPRRTGAAPSARAHARLALTTAAVEGLAKISGGRPLEELVALTAASALVVGAAEHTDEPVVAVSGPAGPVLAGIGLAAGATVGDLVRAADAALRSAPVVADEEAALAGALLVGSARVGAGPAAPASRQHAIELGLTEPGADGVRALVAEAGPDRAEAWFLDVLLRSVSRVLAGFIDPHGPAAALPSAAAEDTAAALALGRRGFEPQGVLTTLTAPIEETVRAHPDRTAVVAGAETLTYGEFWQAAQAVAARLHAAGIGRGHRVGVLTGKTIHAVPAITGTLLAGAAYVPLDPRSPAARLAEILDDAACAAVLAAPELLTGLPVGLTAPVIDIQAAVAGPAAEPGTLPGPLPDDLAYVVYTSGSTGRPKGVEIRHRAIASYVHWKRRNHGLDLDTRLLQLPSLAFDSSIADLFPVLASGGRLVLADTHQLLPRQLAELAQQHRITHLTNVPSLYRVLLGELPRAAASLRAVTVAGEATTPDLVRRHHELLPGVRLINEYGPTESSVGATAFDHGTDAGPGLPIGWPVANTVATVTGADGRALPIGFVGELRLAGHGLADGYRNRPELTAGAFVADAEAPGGRSYRTGDLVWWRPDGMLEFTGRADDQVKIRGHRVEPGEVESVLGLLPGVRQAAVAVVSGPDGAPALAAWLEAVDTTVEEIRARANAALPPAMVPTSLTLIDELPRMVSGKIDRGALVRLAEAGAAPAPASAPTQTGAGGDGIEAKVGAVFEEVLASGPVDLDADFFDEGGHSLLAIAVIDAIEKQLGVSVDMGDFFLTPTVREVSALVRRAMQDQEA
ncbi:non-ribosomal peptide synthetase [Streptomyces sp. KS 21]|uniref:non-ribosomal peptide synthetase n=1 Tax=Streptomyces sp. KS 21 TaxID=2485150 RepID=UPI0010634F79|nr:non-ribosomal peptide synthetase [Streptomyces sp. KS 21]TDU79549.1 amino acid adenylation domain-containing protein [Streptomyces sp. KS 21]